MIHSISPRTGKVVGLRYLQEGNLVNYSGRRKIALNDINACLEATLAGMGIAQLPYISARNDVASGNLIRILGDFPAETTSAYIVYLQNRHLSTNVRVFVDWVVELFAREQETYHNTCCYKLRAASGG